MLGPQRERCQCAGRAEQSAAAAPSARQAGQVGRRAAAGRRPGVDLVSLLSHWDVCSKEWIIRQYDHEVQGADGHQAARGRAATTGPATRPSFLPVRGSTRGLAVGCGINPRYGKLDPYAMAACVIDEAIRNCVAVGADPDRIALLDNFCWGNTERPETLGSLVLAAQACHDLALAYGTPFISGKDSLNNEYTHEGRSLAIPPTLLISAIGQVPDVRSCVTMDLKEPGNLLLVLGMTGASWVARSGPRSTRRPADACPGSIPQSGGRVFEAFTRRSAAAWSGAVMT